jgi:thiamine kinase-like enzyme
MIPQEKSAAVFRGLREAFGATAVEDIRRLTKGLSSDLVFRIVIQGSPFLLRIMTHINERNDPTRVFTAMKAAAEAGLAPRVRYTNIEEGISITDFVEAVSFPTTDALIRIPGTIRKLHALPPFPKAFNYVTMHNGFIWRFRAASLLPSNEIDEAFRQYAQVSSVYPRADSDMVSSHDDLRPENVLFDGHRVWLVGWQAAFVNDRYFDLAVVANFVVNNAAEERTYLQQYFGQEPDEYQLARLFLMRQVMHMLAAAVFLLLGSSGKPVDQSAKTPEFRYFHQRVWAGEVNLADNDAKIVYGRVHWEQLLQNVRQARFDEALRIVADRHKCLDGMRRLLPTAPLMGTASNVPTITI